MYKKLIEEYLTKSGFLSEKEFNNLFPNLKELDVEEVCYRYDPEEDDIIKIIIEVITNDSLYVVSYWESDKSLLLEVNDNCSKEDLDHYSKLLEDNGWTIDHKEELYEDLEYNSTYNKKQFLLSKLQNYSYEELKSLINGN